MSGIFIISTLIGALTTGMEGKLAELRKGRTKVIETNHTSRIEQVDDSLSLLEFSYSRLVESDLRYHQ